MKKKNIPKWKNKSLFEKILFVISIILGIIIIISLLIDFYKQYRFIRYITEPALMLLFIDEFIMYFKYDKKISIITLICFFAVLISFIGYLFFN